MNKFRSTLLMMSLMSILVLSAVGCAQTGSDTMGGDGMEPNMEKSMSGDTMDNSMDKGMDTMDENIHKDMKGDMK